MNVLFFCADWCSPCKGIKPHVIRACKQFGVPMEIVDVDDDPDRGNAYHVTGLPCIVIEHDGVIIDRINETIGEHEMIKRLKEAKGGDYAQG